MKKLIICLMCLMMTSTAVFAGGMTASQSRYLQLQNNKSSVESKTQTVNTTARQTLNNQTQQINAEMNRVQNINNSNIDKSFSTFSR